MPKYQRIRDLREDADMTQKELASLMFMHLNQYRRYECGDSEVPLDVAIRLARLYKVSLDYVAGLTNEKHGLTRSELNAEETRLLRGFQHLDEMHKGRLLERLEILLNDMI